MPSRHAIKVDTEHSYYHVYARGASKQVVFGDEHDYAYFVSLLGRYLSKTPRANAVGAVYPNYRGRVELLAYGLMRTHFHLQIYQDAPYAMAAFMRSLMGSYVLYFNRKYSRTGSPFEGRYRAARATAEGHFIHVGRYIHLNPRYWRRYAYSSLQHYEHTTEPEWLINARVLDLFPSREAYIEFVADYEGNKRMLDEIKHELADH